MKVSIVIPNYNGASLLQKNIPKVLFGVNAFLEKSENSIELIIVDDFSSDSSLQVGEKIIKENKKKNVEILLLKNSRNFGFSTTVNNGAKKATGEYLLLLNSDAYPENIGTFFKDSLSFFDDPLCFAVGFMDKSIESDGSIVLRGRGVGRWRRGLLVHKRGEVNKKETLWVSGGSSIFRRSVWQKLGGMNEMYNPFYWEDIDLSYRALKAGYKIFFDRRCVIIHEHEKGAIKSSRSDFAIKRIVYRNQILFSWANITDFSLFMSHFLWLPLLLVRAVFRLDIAMILGFFSAIIKIPSVFSIRRRMHKIFVKEDKEVIKVT